jgi:hypothetical protein
MFIHTPFQLAGALLLLLSALGGSPRHGTWVYSQNGRSLLETDPTGQALLAFCRENKVTEIYLSVGAAPLKDPGTPALLRSLKQAGLRVEALVDGPTAWQLVPGILSYNAKQVESARFDGVHYDEEPWTGKGDDNSWVGPLLEHWQSVRALLSGTGMSLSTDISAVKFAHLSPEAQDKLVGAVSTLVLMAYEAPEPTLERRFEAWLDRKGRAPGNVMVATRLKDFGDASRHAAALSARDARYVGRNGYAGWATFSYNEYLKTSPGSGTTPPGR